MHFSTTAASVLTLTLSSTVHGMMGKVWQVDTGRKILRGTSEEVANPWHKFNGNLSERSTKYFAAGKTGTAPAIPKAHDGEYLTPVKIGTPAGTYMMSLDTGSADLWVASTELPAGERKGKTVYNPAKSKTSKKVSKTWNIQYGEGNARGNVYADTVSVGGLTHAGQNVEVAEHISSNFARQRQFDGLFGLAFNSLNTCKPTVCSQFFINVKGSLAAPLFGVNFLKTAPGSFDFGYIDKTYAGKLSYTPVDEGSGYWLIHLSAFGVGSRNFHVGSFRATPDTGTSILYMPDSVLNHYYARVPYEVTEDGVVVHCGGSFPDLSFSIGGKYINIPGSDIPYAPIGGGNCLSALQSAEGLPFAVLGDVFLKNSYAVYDAGNSRFGAAQK